MKMLSKMIIVVVIIGTFGLCTGDVSHLGENNAMNGRVQVHVLSDNRTDENDSI